MTVSPSLTPTTLPGGFSEMAAYGQIRSKIETMLQKEEGMETTNTQERFKEYYQLADSAMSPYG